jgi:hypothetical protein
MGNAVAMVAEPKEAMKLTLGVFVWSLAGLVWLTETVELDDKLPWNGLIAWPDLAPEFQWG